FLDLLTGNKVSVGPPFFNATFVPICAPLFAALCVGPFLGWKRAELWPALLQLRVAFVISVIVAIVASYAIDGRATLAAIAFGFGVWLIVGSLVEFASRLRLGRVPLADSLRRFKATPRASLGMTIAHTALGFVVLGAVATSAWHLELMHTMKPGETVSFAGYQVTLQKVAEVKGANYIAERATLAVAYDGRPYTTMQPERRLFLVQRRQVAETAIHTNLLRDFYVTLGEGDANGGWVIRLYLNPLAPWIWLGAAMCAFGGFVSLSDRRLRIGAPSRRPVVQAAE
ncbi:MAG TPA: cytochrome c-type biogenesis CcmF C-terminal domain-containing protein, partial [Reyranella sp.]|nr:cytochrome c-type biogenesis CcmF C-terminal domain-containing protein [Reyranella sp.]